MRAGRALLSRVRQDRERNQRNHRRGNIPGGRVVQHRRSGPHGRGRLPLHHRPLEGGHQPRGGDYKSHGGRGGRVGPPGRRLVRGLQRTARRPAGGRRYRGGHDVREAAIGPPRPARVFGGKARGAEVAAVPRLHGLPPEEPHEQAPAREARSAPAASRALGRHEHHRALVRGGVPPPGHPPRRSHPGAPGRPGRRRDRAPAV